jgi:hypothetical protein
VSDDEKIPEDISAMLGASLAASMARSKTLQSELRGHVAENGEVRLLITGDNGVTVPVILTETSAARWRDALSKLWTKARRVNRRNRGADAWITWPDPANRGVYFVKHSDHVRRFCSTIVRRKHRCETCNTYAPPGATMYREQAPKSYAYQNWRKIRICTTCIARPVPLDA